MSLLSREAMEALAARLRIEFLENTNTGEVHRVIYIGKTRYVDERCNLDDCIKLEPTKGDLYIDRPRRCGNCWDDATDEAEG